MPRNRSEYAAHAGLKAGIRPQAIRRAPARRWPAIRTACYLLVVLIGALTLAEITPEACRAADAPRWCMD